VNDNELSEDHEDIGALRMSLGRKGTNGLLGVGKEEGEKLTCSLATGSMLESAMFANKQGPNEKLSDFVDRDVLENTRILDPEYRKKCLEYVNSLNKKTGLSGVDAIKLEEILEIAQASVKDLDLALYFIKLVARTAKIPEAHAMLKEMEV
jgi:hypothetical protein